LKVATKKSWNKEDARWITWICGICGLSFLVHCL
jgi:uncharacterized membrane protein YdcZ (DUF606 family)